MPLLHGSLTRRGHPWIRGLVCGLMTALGGSAILPFLIFDLSVRPGCCCNSGFDRARRYLVDPAPLHGHARLFAFLQVGLGGLLVFIAGLLIGSA